MTKIGDYAFDDTSWYNNQDDGIVYINNVLYKYKGTMPGSTSLLIQDGTVSISRCAFWECTRLRSIAIPNSVTEIGSNAFTGCTGLRSITIPNSVTKIGEGAFDGCSNLKSVINLSKLTISTK